MITDEQLRQAIRCTGYRWDGSAGTRAEAVERVAFRFFHLMKRQEADARRLKSVRRAAIEFNRGQAFDEAAGRAEAKALRRRLGFAERIVRRLADALEGRGDVYEVAREAAAYVDPASAAASPAGGES